MIAKIITEGSTRDEALARMRAALAATEVAGSVTNVAFLSALAGHDGFARGEVDTGLIERDFDALTAPVETPPEARALAAITALGLPGEGGAAFARSDGFRLWGPAASTIKLDDELVRVEQEGEHFTVTAGEERTSLRVAHDGARLLVATADRNFTARAVRHGLNITVFMDGAHGFSLTDPLAAAADQGAGGDSVAAPMPGLVKTVTAGVGDEVEAGDALATMEAMKMEHTLKAPRAGIIAKVSAAPGDQVEEGAVLITLEAEDA